jgi:purine-binding chemotaxis protein CheW
MSQVEEPVSSPESDVDEEEEIQVLEFELGEETYCVDIQYVSEVVDMGQLTAVPNQPHHVEGVMDLRGRTTSIINPKRLLGVPDDGDRRRIIVLDRERLVNNETVGWVVDEVHQVVRLSPDDVGPVPVGEDESMLGLYERQDSFVIWLDPSKLSS